MSKSKIIVSIIEMLVGIALVAAGFLGVIDSFWSGVGGTLALIGALYTLRNLRLRRNPAYMEQYNVEVNDERNSFLRSKAWSWAGYLFVMITGVGTIVCKIIGREDLMMFCSMSVCLIMVLYWVSYYVLKNKY